MGGAVIARNAIYLWLPSRIKEGELIFVLLLLMSARGISIRPLPPVCPHDECVSIPFASTLHYNSEPLLFIATLYKEQQKQQPQEQHLNYGGGDICSIRIRNRL